MDSIVSSFSRSLPRIVNPDIIKCRQNENMVDFMRADLDSGMQYSAIEITVRKMLKLQGRDFNKEFEKWKKGRD